MPLEVVTNHIVARAAAASSDNLFNLSQWYAKYSSQCNNHQKQVYIYLDYLHVYILIN